MKLAANLLGALLMLFAAHTAAAQSTYPNRPVKILVGFTPGTAPDVCRAHPCRPVCGSLGVRRS